MKKSTMKRWAPAVPIILLVASIMWNPHKSTLVIAQTSDLGYTIYLPLAQKKYDPSWMWGETTLVTLLPEPNSKPFITIDHGGRVYIFWDAWPSSGEAFIYYIHQTDDGWSTPMKIANTLGISKVLYKPLVSPDGHIHLLWYNELAPGGPYRLMYTVFDGNRWIPEEEVARFSNPNRSGVLNFDGQNNIHVVYPVTGILSTSYFHRLRTPAGWSAAEDITPQTNGTVYQWKVFPDQSGGVRFIGKDLNDHLFFVFWENGKFQTGLQPIQDAIWTDYAVLDAQDNLHLYRIDEVPVPGGYMDGLYHQCLDNNLNWMPEQILSGEDSIGNNFSITWDTLGRVVFGWKSLDDNYFDLVLLNGCSQPIRKIGNLSHLSEPTRWGYLDAAVLSNQPNKFCALIEVPYQSQKSGLVCADILP